MKKSKSLLFLSALCAVTLCFGVASVGRVSAESVNGWENRQNGKSVLSDVSGDTEISTAGNTAFGSSFVLNEEIADGLYGEYDLTFTLKANLTKGEEVWISIVGIYETEEDEDGETNVVSVSRTGLHFTSNDWMNVALYGNLGTADKGFAQVVNKNENFPSLSSAVDVKLAYRYDGEGHTVQTLSLNGVDIMVSDLTETYGYYYVHTDAVGFDLYNASEDVTISNVRAVCSDSEKNYRKTNINDYIYYGKTGEFTAKRLTTTIDTTDEVFAFTESEQINAGMFSNGKSHNYEAFVQISAVELKEGAFEYGFYPWYRNVDNHVLLETDGEKFRMVVTVGGEVSLVKEAACSPEAGDEFAFVKRSFSDGTTALTATLKGVVLEAEGVEGIFENYFIGVYGKNVQVSYKGISTKSFYVAYDFTEQKEWITSGSDQDAWDVEGEWPVVTLTDDYAGNTIGGISVAVTGKVVNDDTAFYEMTFDVQSEGNTAYGVVPYFNSDADYVLAGVENTGGTCSLFIRSSRGAGETRAIGPSAETTVRVRREGQTFTVSVDGSEETLTVTIEGLTEISEYYGFFAAGKGSATVTNVTYDGFISFKEYEENGWIRTSVEKQDVQFLGDNAFTIDGNYTEAGLTADTEQKLAKIIRAEDYTNDYVIEVDLTKIAEPDGQCQRIGLVAWYLNEENYIVIFVDQWTVWEAYQLNCCGIYNGERMTDSSFNEYEWFLGFLDSPGYINQTFRLKVIKNGQTLKGFINGTMIFNKTFEDKYDLTVYDDDTLYLGMFSAGVKAKFENYGVRAMTDGEGTKTPSKGNRPTEPEDVSVPGSSAGEGASDNNPESLSESGKKKGCGSAVGSGIFGMLFLALTGMALLKKRMNLR